MNNTDIFYTILQDLQFFSYFFYKQYLLDIKSNTAYDIKNNSSQLLAMFFKQHPIKEYFEATTNITYLNNNGILIKDTKQPNFYVVLYMNASLDFTNTTILSLEHPPLFNEKDSLEDFLYKNITHPIYIVFFSFYSNLDLSNQETTTYIVDTIKSTLENCCCYFQHLQYNCYYLLFKGISDIEILNYCIAMHHTFTTIKKPYLAPKFLVTEYLNNEDLISFITKTKHRFLQKNFKEEIIIKENAENI